MTSSIAELENLEAFTVEISDQIAHLQLCRPDAFNTMNTAFWRELPLIVDAIDRESVARVIVISSTGKHFTAGMDLSVFADMGNLQGGEPARAAETLRRLVLQLQDTFNSLERARMPVLVAIQGGCIGGGVDMICAADCRYATEDSFFVVKETEIGITADVGTLQRLPKLVPEGLARELAYTSRKMLAAEALNAGLVNKVYGDHQQMLDDVFAIAKQIAANSPLAVAGTKQMFNYGRNHGVNDGLNYMATWQAGMFHQADLMESMTATGEKRSANYEALAKLGSLL